MCKHVLSQLRAISIFTTVALFQVNLAPAANADVLLSGVNGDLTTSLGVDWEIRQDVNWLSAFVPSLTEGSHALRVTQTKGSENWEPGLKLAGGEALANLILAHDTFEYDVAPTTTMSWRQSCVVLNGNNETVGWNQTPETGLPNPGLPTHMVVDLTPWKPKAQAWLDETNPDARTYFELLVGLQGQELAPTADADSDFEVDGADIIIWQRNLGNMEAGIEQGDFNFDFIVDGADLDSLREQFGRSTELVASTFDNFRFVTASAAAAAIPEPTALSCGLIAVLFGAMSRRSITRKAG